MALETTDQNTSTARVIPSQHPERRLRPQKAVEDLRSWLGHSLVKCRYHAGIGIFIGFSWNMDDLNIG